MHDVRISEHELLMKALPDLTRLALWHVFDRVAKGDASLEFALDAWTMVWFFCPWHISPDAPQTPRADRALYKRIIHDLEDLLEKHRPGLDSRRFSEEAFACLDPFFSEYDREHHRNPPKNLSWFGCLGYASDQRDPTRATLHFYNACCPESPFGDMDALFDDMRLCVRHLRRADPRIERVSCGSWINNLQPFLSLFPARYVSSLQVSDPNAKSGMGWWGQFVRKDGTLNEERAEKLRRTGTFHYDRKRGECALGELIDHVDAHFL